MYIFRPCGFGSTLQFLLAMTQHVPVVIVSVPSEYQSAPSAPHSVVVDAAAVKHNMSE